jgi:hypothetical protein
MGFLLLGIDSLIACIAVGPIVNQRWCIPLAALFGICDGGGFLIGSAFHWSVPDNISNIVTTAVLLALGLYWIAIAVFASKTQVNTSRWGLWVLPFVLSIDNITFGIVDGVSKTASVWVSAGEQLLSSAILAGIGLAVGIGLARAIPAWRRHQAVANGIAGGALIVASGILLLVG